MARQVGNGRGMVRKNRVIKGSGMRWGRVRIRRLLRSNRRNTERTVKKENKKK